MTEQTSRPSRALLAPLILAVALSGCAVARARAGAANAPAVAAAGLSSGEREVVASVDAFRAAHGLRALTVDPQLEQKARAWALWMAAGHCGTAPNGSPAICHSALTSGITARWTRLEENVGEATPASNLTGVLNGLEHSPEHVANMLNGSIGWIGAGVVVAHGTVLVAEEFMAT